MQKSIQIGNLNIPRIFINLLISLFLIIAFVSYFEATTGDHLVITVLIIIAALGFLFIRFAKFGVLFIAIYFPFEEIILKYLPVSDTLYSSLRYMGEIMIYALFIAVIFHKIWKKSLKGTPLDIALLFFVVISIISAIINGSNAIEVLLFFRSLFRYVFLFYAVSNLDLSSDFIKKLIYALIIIGLIQVFIGFGQVVLGAPLNNLLKPRPSDLSIAGHQKHFNVLYGGREQGSMFGTTGDTVSLALFLMISLALSTSFAFFQKGYRKPLLVIAGGLFMAGIIYTYSRGTFFAALLTLLIVSLIKNKKLLLVFSITAVLFFLSIVPIKQIAPTDYKESSTVRQSPIVDIAQIFSDRYQKTASTGRLYIINAASGKVLSEGTIFGFGPTFELENRFYLMRDVYWVFILYKTGILGLASFIFIFIKLTQIAWQVFKKSGDKTIVILALSYLAILAGVSLQNFFIPVSEIRTASLYFWLFGGLLIPYWRKLSLNKKSLPLVKS